MRSRRNHSQQDNSFWNHRIHNDRQENSVVFSQVIYHHHRFWNTSFQINWGNASICIANIKSFFFQAVLQSVYVYPKLVFNFRRIAQQFQTFQRSYGLNHRQSFCKHLRTQIVFQIINNILICCHKSTNVCH